MVYHPDWCFLQDNQLTSLSLSLSLKQYTPHDNQYHPVTSVEFPQTGRRAKRRQQVLNWVKSTTPQQNASTHTLLAETFGCVLKPPCLTCVRTGSAIGSEVYATCACALVLRWQTYLLLVCWTRSSSGEFTQQKVPMDDFVGPR